MARARLIKPAFFGDVTLSEVSRDARLLYTGLWQLMDRRGLMEYHPKLVKRDLFPYDDDVGAPIIEGWVAELARIGRLRVVRFEGKRYLHCPHLPKHQSFHHREEPNALIPGAVALAPDEARADVPGQPQASPGPDSVEPSASRTEADTEAEAGERSVSVSEETALSEKPAGKKRARHEYPPEFEALWAKYPEQYRGTKWDGFRQWDALAADDKVLFLRALRFVEDYWRDPPENARHLKDFCRFVSKDDWKGWLAGPPPTHARGVKPQPQVLSFGGPDVQN